MKGNFANYFVLKIIIQYVEYSFRYHIYAVINGVMVTRFVIHAEKWHSWKNKARKLAKESVFQELELSA